MDSFLKIYVCSVRLCAFISSKSLDMVGVVVLLVIISLKEKLDIIWIC